jgi:hypothetical protein
MSEYDWQLSNGAPLCVFSDSFYSSVRNAIFQQLTKESTKEQFQAALAHLTQLRDELVQHVYPMHYGSLVGSHRCVDHLYREAVATLRGLEIMQPVPAPQSAPQPPPPPRETLADVVRDLKESLQPSRDETPLGIDAELPDTERPR